MKLLNFIKHNLQKLCIGALAVAAVAVLLEKEHEHAPAIVIATTTTVILLYTYVQYSDTQSLVPGVVALEVLLFVAAQHQVAAQVIVTVIFAACVELAAAYAIRAAQTSSPESANAALPLEWKQAWSNVFHVTSTVYYYAWLTMRSIFIVFAGTEPLTRWWYLSQLFVVLCLLAISGNTQEAQFVTLALATAAGLLYSYKDTIPWGISIVLLTIPPLYIVNSIVPTSQPPITDATPSPVGNKWQRANKFFYSNAFVASAAVCVAAAVVWQRQHAEDMTVRTEVCNAQNNLVLMTAQCNANLQVGMSCCCAKNHIYYTEAGCIPYSCADAVQTGLFDCCGNAITAEHVKRLSGKYMCIDGQAPATL